MLSNSQVLCLPSLTPRIMFNYDRGYNKSWNMQAYKTPRIYQDPQMEMKKRKFASQKKGEKSNRYLTKKGNYMDYHIKVQKSLPSPTSHNKQTPWSFQKQQKASRSISIDQNLKKNTYLEQIQNEQAKRRKPGIGIYSIEKSLKDKQQAIQKLKRRVVKATQRRYFIEDTQHLSDNVPGTANYYPKTIDTSLISNQKRDYKYWVAKHKQQRNEDLKRQKRKPTVGTYNPLDQSFQTFDTISRSSSSKSLSSKNGFGSDSRFCYNRPDKKKIKEIRPSPGTYQTRITWKGKGFKSEHKSWHQAIQKGSPRKRY